MNYSTDGNSTLLSSVNILYLPVWTAAFSVNLILGLPAHVYILWMIVTKAEGTMSSEIFTLNLTVCEVIFCLGSLLNILYVYFQLNCALIQVIYFSWGFILAGRPLFQCCICVERYLAVVHPVTFMRYKPLRYRLRCCALCWLTVLGSCIVQIFCPSESEREYCTLFFTLVVICVMLFCCLAVLRALKNPGPGDGEREGTNHFKMRAFRIILVIFVAMVINYLPLIAILPLQLHFDNKYTNLVTSLSSISSVASGFVQPLVFLHSAGKLPCIDAP